MERPNVYNAKNYGQFFMILAIFLTMAIITYHQNVVNAQQITVTDQLGEVKSSADCEIHDCVVELVKSANFTSDQIARQTPTKEASVVKVNDLTIDILWNEQAGMYSIGDSTYTTAGRMRFRVRELIDNELGIKRRCGSAACRERKL